MQTIFFFFLVTKNISFGKLLSGLENGTFPCFSFFDRVSSKNPFVAPEATGATAAAGGSNRRASSLMFIRTHTASEDE